MTMLGEHKHVGRLHGSCPLDMSTDYYKLEVWPNGFLDADEFEKILAEWRDCTSFQEDLFKELQECFNADAWLRLTGRHGKSQNKIVSEGWGKKNLTSKERLLVEKAESLIGESLCDISPVQIQPGNFTVNPDGNSWGDTYPAEPEEKLAEFADRAARQMFFRAGMRAFGEWVDKLSYTIPTPPEPDASKYAFGLDGYIIQDAKRRMREWQDSQVTEMQLDKRYCKYMAWVYALVSDLKLPAPTFKEYEEHFKYEGGSRYYAFPLITKVIPKCECQILCGAGIALPKALNETNGG